MKASIWASDFVDDDLVSVRRVVMRSLCWSLHATPLNLFVFFVVIWQSNLSCLKGEALKLRPLCWFRQRTYKVRERDGKSKALSSVNEYWTRRVVQFVISFSISYLENYFLLRFCDLHLMQWWNSRDFVRWGAISPTTSIIDCSRSNIANMRRLKVSVFLCSFAQNLHCSLNNVSDQQCCNRWFTSAFVESEMETIHFLLVCGSGSPVSDNIDFMQFGAFERVANVHINLGEWECVESRKRSLACFITRCHAHQNYFNLNVETQVNSIESCQGTALRREDCVEIQLRCSAA